MLESQGPRATAEGRGRGLMGHARIWARNRGQGPRPRAKGHGNSQAQTAPFSQAARTARQTGSHPSQQPEREIDQTASHSGRQSSQPLSPLFSNVGVLWSVSGLVDLSLSFSIAPLSSLFLSGCLTAWPGCLVGWLPGWLADWECLADVVEIYLPLSLSLSFFLSPLCRSLSLSGCEPCWLYGCLGCLTGWLSGCCCCCCCCCWWWW